MPKSTFQKQQELRASLKEYWGQRAVTQLRYLSEMLKAGIFTDESLLDAAVDWLYNRYKENGAVARGDVEELEQLLAPAKSTAKSITVSCVGHAHIDMNWMWAFDETVIITIETFRTMLQLMKEYPEFTFMQSQASVYKIIEEFAPEMLPEIIDRIKSGQWEVTASTWVETDKNMPSGESLTRHLLYTRQYLKRLLGLSDDDFRIDFEPDTFGHCAQVPEILSSGGVKYYYHCRGYEEHSLYKWEAPSGAQVTVLREPTWYNEQICNESFLYTPGYCKANGINRLCHVYGVGDHGGGVTRRDIERILDMSTWTCMPAIGFGKLGDYFKYLEQQDLPVVKGELNFVFDGCYTTQTRIKKANRVAERSLGAAEALGALAQLCGGYKASAEDFVGAWENVLFSHFHDILPGSGVIGTREYAMGMFQRTMAAVGARTNSAVRALSANINTSALLPEAEIIKESFAEGGGVGFGAPAFRYTEAAGFTGGEKRLFNVFNPTEADFDGLVELKVWDWEFAPERACVKDENKNIIPVQLVDSKMQSYWTHSYFRVLIPLKIDAFGYRTVLLEENNESDDTAALYGPYGPQPRVDRPSEFILENDNIRAVFSSDGMLLESLTDKANGKELISGKSGFFFTMEDDCEGMTSWRVGRHTDTVPVCKNLRIKNRVNGTLRQAFTYECEIADSRIEGSRLLITVSLDAGSRVLKYSAVCRWREIGLQGKGLPQLYFGLIPTEACDSYRYDTPFAEISRPALDYDVPAQSYACAPSGESGIMLMTDSKYGFRCTKNQMAVTLIRSSYNPDNLPEIYDHEFEIGVGVMGDASPAELRCESVRFCNLPMPLAASSHSGALPLSGQLLSVAGEGITVSAVKAAEDGSDSLILRLCELAGKEQEAVVTLPKPPASAAVTDCHEEPLMGENTVISGNTVKVKLRPFGVTTIKIII